MHNADALSPAGSYTLGTGPARSNTHPVIKIIEPREQIPITNEELRQFSSSIAKDCDEAFNSSLLEPSPKTSIDLSYCSSGAQALSLDIRGVRASLTSQAPSKPWDSRPLPPSPPTSESILQEMMQARPATRPDTYGRVASVQGGSSKRSALYEQLALPLLPSMTPQQTERRAVSAPVYARFSKQVDMLPSIIESQGSEVEKARTVSAPPAAGQSGGNRFHGRTAEYLTEAERSIRVVNSPVYESPVKAPKPLNLRKKSNHGRRMEHEGSIADTAQGRFIPPATSHASRPVTPAPAHDGPPDQGAMKKRKFWFKRVSKEQPNVAGFGNSNQDTPHSQESYGMDPYVDAGPIHSPPIEPKKRGLFHSFWRSSKPEPKMFISGMLNYEMVHRLLADQIEDSNDEDTSPETDRIMPPDFVRNSGRYLPDECMTDRKIEPRQNWLARLFNVKPAVRYMCFTISRRRCRQEIAILLREWRKYGMRDIQVDKARNIVFARVGARNCKTWRNSRALRCIRAITGC